MVISVLERRSEIGLRRALGATKGHIRTQFLAEAILLAPAGGAAGALATATRPTRKEASLSGETKATRPEDVTRLVAERLNAGDAAGVAALYERHAVLAYPADRPVTGREAIQAIYQQMIDAGMKFAIETHCPPSGSRT
jgi:hypothetical protein